MSWTDERVERLKTLWADGLTASEIARELGGVSRNAVIGKAHRLGLSNRAGATQKVETDSEDQAEVTMDEAKKPEARTAEEPAEPRSESVAGAAAKETAKPAVASKTEAPTAEAPSSDAPASADVATEADEATPPAPVEETVNPVAALAAEVERKARKLSLLELNERTCKWPIGDPSTDDFYFCGLPCAPDKPYCAAHVAVAYQPMSSRRDRDRSRNRAATA